MATQSKRWPNNCEWARLDAIALARQAREGLMAVLDDVNSPVVLVAMVRSIDRCREIESRLVAVGPHEKDEG